MVVKSSTWATAGAHTVKTITSAEPITAPIVRMVGFSFDTFGDISAAIGRSLPVLVMVLIMVSLRVLVWRPAQIRLTCHE
jgi:hypothetical protein